MAYAAFGRAANGMPRSTSRSVPRVDGPPGSRAPRPARPIRTRSLRFATWSFATPDLTSGIASTPTVGSHGRCRRQSGHLRLRGRASAELVSRGTGGQRSTGFNVAAYAGMTDDGAATHSPRPMISRRPLQEIAAPTCMCDRVGAPPWSTRPLAASSSVIAERSWATAASSADRGAMPRRPATGRSSSRRRIRWPPATSIAPSRGSCTCAPLTARSPRTRRRSVLLRIRPGLATRSSRARPRTASG